MRRTLLSVAALGLTLAGAACGAETPNDAAVATSVATSTAPAPTGRVVEVKMVTDGNGSYFEPARVVAKPGNVVRFVLASGVHNVSFPADRNAGSSGLPEAGPYLQMAGQTYDYTVGVAPGTYQFVCDPHAALGMVGTLTVE